MYYWSKKVSTTTLEKELLAVEDVKEVHIATAFFSDEGLRILRSIVKKNGLPPNRVHLYVSDQFSYLDPHELLMEACKIAQVNVFLDHPFHAKVYWLKGAVNKVIFGSSNFTAGGFSKNIEFDSIEEMQGVKLDDVRRFFGFCDSYSTRVTDDVIKYYKDHQADFAAFREAQKKLKKGLGRK